jgi:putative addiction module CopG family antidote
MQVHLTDDQKAFIREGVQSGRFAREEDALREALSLWEARERRRAEILAAADQAEASFARGEGRKITSREETTKLADEIKRRGVAKLAAKENAAEPRIHTDSHG